MRLKQLNHLKLHLLFLCNLMFQLN